MMSSDVPLSATDDVDDVFASELISPVSNIGFDVIYNPNSVVLSVVSALPGDYNGNGTVDAADYTVWRNTLGDVGINLAADGNGNGLVDDGDYDFWKSHFGETAGSGSSGAASVPEPGGFMLLLVAILGGFCRAGRLSC
jgi:hypothetical protein